MRATRTIAKTPADVKAWITKPHYYGEALKADESRDPMPHEVAYLLLGGRDGDKKHELLIPSAVNRLCFLKPATNGTHIFEWDNEAEKASGANVLEQRIVLFTESSTQALDYEAAKKAEYPSASILAVADRRELPKAIAAFVNHDIQMLIIPSWFGVTGWYIRADDVVVEFSEGFPAGATMEQAKARVRNPIYPQRRTQ